MDVRLVLEHNEDKIEIINQSYRLAALKEGDIITFNNVEKVEEREIDNEYSENRKESVKVWNKETKILKTIKKIKITKITADINFYEFGVDSFVVTYYCKKHE